MTINFIPMKLSDWTPFSFYADLFGAILQRN